MPTVEVIMTSDERRLFQGMQRLIGQQTKMEQGYKRIGTQAKQAGGGAQQAFGGMSGALGPMNAIAGALGVGGGAAAAVQFLRSEYEGLSTAAQKAGEKQVTIAGAIRDLKRNLAAPTNAAIRTGNDQFLADLDQIISTVPQKAEAIGLATTLISSTNRDFAKTLGGVKQITSVFSDAPDAWEDMGKAMAHTAAAAGVAIEDALPLMMGIMGTSAITSPVAFGQNAPKAFKQAKGFVDDFRGNAAMFSQLTIEMADTEGRISKTATAQLAKEMAAFFRNNKDLQRISEDQNLKLFEMINILQSNPELARQFVEGAAFGQAEGVLRQLFLDPMGDVARAFQAAADSFPTFDETNDMGAAVIKSLEEGKGAAVYGLEQALSGLTAKYLGDDSEMGFEGVLRRNIDPLLESAGMSPGQRKGIYLETVLGEGSGAYDKALIRVLEQRAAGYGADDPKGKALQDIADTIREASYKIPGRIESDFRSDLSDMLGTMAVDKDAVLAELDRRAAESGRNLGEEAIVSLPEMFPDNGPLGSPVARGAARIVGEIPNLDTFGRLQAFAPGAPQEGEGFGDLLAHIQDTYDARRATLSPGQRYFEDLGGVGYEDMDAATKNAWDFDALDQGYAAVAPLAVPPVAAEDVAPEDVAPAMSRDEYVAAANRYAALSPGQQYFEDMGGGDWESIGTAAQNTMEFRALDQGYGEPFDAAGAIAAFDEQQTTGAADAAQPVPGADTGEKGSDSGVLQTIADNATKQTELLAALKEHFERGYQPLSQRVPADAGAGSFE